MEKPPQNPDRIRKAEEMDKQNMFHHNYSSDHLGNQKFLGDFTKGILKKIPPLNVKDVPAHDEGINQEIARDMI